MTDWKIAQEFTEEERTGLAEQLDNLSDVIEYLNLPGSEHGFDTSNIEATADFLARILDQMQPVAEPL